MSEKKQTASEALRVLLAAAPRSRRTAGRLLREAGFTPRQTGAVLRTVDWQKQADALVGSLPRLEEFTPDGVRGSLLAAGFTWEEAQDAIRRSRTGKTEDLWLEAVTGMLSMGPGTLRSLLRRWGYGEAEIDAALPASEARWVERILASYSESDLGWREILVDVGDRGHSVETIGQMLHGLAENAPERAVRRARSMAAEGRRRREIRTEMREAGFSQEQVQAALQSLSENSMADYIIDRYLRHTAVSLGDLRETLKSAGIEPAAIDKALARRGVISTDWVSAAREAIADMIAERDLGPALAAESLKTKGYSPAQIRAGLDSIDWVRSATERADAALASFEAVDRPALRRLLAGEGYSEADIDAALAQIWVPADSDPDVAAGLLRAAAARGCSEGEAGEILRRFFREEEVARVMAQEEPDWQKAAEESLGLLLESTSAFTVGPGIAEGYLRSRFTPEQAQAALAAVPIDWAESARTVADAAYLFRISAEEMDAALERMAYSAEDRAAARERYDALVLEAADIRPA